MFSTLFSRYTFIYREFPCFFMIVFQSCLLQICCKWEGVNKYPMVCYPSVWLVISREVWSGLYFNHCVGRLIWLKASILMKINTVFMPQVFNSFLKKSFLPSPGSSVGSDAGFQSRCCELEPQLGQYSFQHLTKVTVTFVFHQWANSLCGKAASCLESISCWVLVWENQETYE